MVTGHVIRYDNVRGYGFIAPDGGGEDVFLHVNDLLFPSTQVKPGTLVQFEVEEGERGLKAALVDLAASAGGELLAPAARPHPGASSADETLCDVLDAQEFRQEITELLLRSVPSLTAQHVLVARESLVKHARAHGWVVD
ncbi:cold shock domain-containing protein [Streptomyces sp. NPDC013178]|uniref:cold-shock protein n=1 Tax=Streptomyces sp. NPDC013178 TaxID=3155118 RepID=UPI0033C4C06F